MKFQISLRQLQYKRNQHVAEINKRLQELIKQSARVWLAEVIPRVPVWSGASRATFEHLAAAAGVTVPISPTPTAPDRIPLGRIHSRGGIEKTGKGVWRFYYETDLEYLIANETQNVKRGEYGLRGRLITPTPYQFREAGSKAVEDFLSKQDLLPPPVIGRK